MESSSLTTRVIPWLAVMTSLVTVKWVFQYIAHYFTGLFPQYNPRQIVPVEYIGEGFEFPGRLVC